MGAFYFVERVRNMNELRKRFLNELRSDVEESKLLVVAVELPTGATELITNTEYISEKVGYYISAYDDDFKLQANPAVRIVGYMIV